MAVDSAVDVIIPIVYTIIIATAVFGNSMFIAAVTRNAKLHSSVYIFLANECISDLIFIIFTIFVLIFYFMAGWIFGDVMCKIVGFCGQLCVTVSIFSLSAVAVERYMLICNISQNKKTTRWCLKVCAGTWVIAVLVSAPILYGFGTYVHKDYENDADAPTTDQRTNATNTTVDEVVFFCDGDYFTDTGGLIYYCILAVVTYVIPLAILVVTHWKIFQALKKKRTSTINNSQFNSIQFDNTNSIPSENTYARAISDMQAKKVENTTARNRKVIKMLITITITFLVLWTPYVAWQIVRRVIKPPGAADRKVAERIDIAINKRIAQIIRGVIFLFVTITPTTNFFITLKMSADFKGTVAMMLRKLKCCAVSRTGGMEARVGTGVTRNPMPGGVPYQTQESTLSTESTLSLPSSSAFVESSMSAELSRRPEESFTV